MIDLFNIVQFFKDFNFEFVCVALEFLIFPALNILNFPRLVFSVWNMSSSKLKSSFGFLVGFGGLSRNPFGGCNIMSSLTLFRGTGLGFTLSHFPVIGGEIGLLMLSLFNSNLINCDLLNSLYWLVSKPLLGKVVILLL